MGHVYEKEISGRNLSIETGDVAKQAGGAAVVRYGDSVVLVTACGNETPRQGIDFLPLVVDYVEKTFAVGKIPGGFFKREGRLSEYEVLTSRLIDRPIRPLFPKGFYNETQVIATVLSADKENDTGVLAMIGASTALTLSDLPFGGPIAGARVGRIDGKLVLNPLIPDLAKSDLNIFVAGSRDAILMVEGEAGEVPEEEVLDAILFAHESLRPILEMQERMRKEIGRPKRPIEKKELPEEDLGKIAGIAENDLRAAYDIQPRRTPSSRTPSRTWRSGSSGGRSSLRAGGSTDGASRTSGPSIAAWRCFPARMAPPSSRAGRPRCSSRPRSAPRRTSSGSTPCWATQPRRSCCTTTSPPSAWGR